MPEFSETFFSDLLTASLRLFLAALLGGVVGWDRESNKKPAGLRTHMMVCLGSAAFMLFALKVFDDLKGPSSTGMDPTRIIEGIVGGIGFLGAGSIIQRGASVEGITTAAGIWVVGAVGVACGAGYYAIAAVTVAFTLLILRVVGMIARRTKAV
jgi:putative Mg2+ transporter-C (MgtC) family protein